jgi:hypothetical protein
MNLADLQFIVPRYWKLLPRLATVFAILFISSSGEARAPRYPETNVTRGWTSAGYPYMSGGISSDEQKAMERAAQPFNLKLIFARRAGTPVAPAFVMIGTNNDRRIEKIVLRAPWFYIQLPPGGYTILARFNRHVVLIKGVYLREGPHKTYLLRGD